MFGILALTIGEILGDSVGLVMVLSVEHVPGSAMEPQRHPVVEDTF